MLMLMLFNYMAMCKTTGYMIADKKPGRKFGSVFSVLIMIHIYPHSLKNYEQRASMMFI